MSGGIGLSGPPRRHIGKREEREMGEGVKRDRGGRGRFR